MLQTNKDWGGIKKYTKSVGSASDVRQQTSSSQLPRDPPPTKLVFAHHTERINSVPLPQKVKVKYIKRLWRDLEEGSLLSKPLHSLYCHFLFMNKEGGTRAPGGSGRWGLEGDLVALHSLLLLYWPWIMHQLTGASLALLEKTNKWHKAIRLNIYGRHSCPGVGGPRSVIAFSVM